MKRTISNFLAVVIVGMISVVPINTAQAQGLAIAVKAGTMGPGVDVAIPLGRKLVVRAGGTFLNMSRTQTEGDEEITVQFDADVSWSSFSGMIDFHPFEGGFRLTAGAYLDNREVTALGKPITEYDLDGKIFQPERLGSLSATFKYDQAISPYLGIGFGDMTRRSRVGFLFDMGMIYTGEPTFEMVGTGMIAQTADWAATMQEGLKSFTWMPVISLGVSLRLF